MKYVIFLLALTLVPFFTNAQTDSIAMAEEFERVVGDWDGSFEFSVSEDGKEKASMPAKCTTKWNGKTWEFEIQYDEGEGVITGGEDKLELTADPKVVNMGGIQWKVTEFRMSGDTTVMSFEFTGKEKRKFLTTKKTIVVTSTSFSMLEYSKYDTDPAFIFRTRHTFRKAVAKK
ncbi:MAG: hypothetical protein ACKVOK_09115 [Flavobacteriales bacterium]